MMRRKSWLYPLAGLLGTALMLVLAGCQSGPSYPSKEITYIVPADQGASTDLMTRSLADAVSKNWPGAKISLKNVGAAGGTAAAGEVFGAKPDGYTVGMMMLMPLTMQPHLMGDKIPYKGPGDFTIVNEVLTRANVLVVPANSKYKTLQDLVDDFKKGGRTEPFTFVGRGVGNAEDLTMQMLAKAAGIPGKFKVVPFQNDGEGIAQVIGGHVEGSAFMWASEKAHVAEGRLRPLVTFIAFPGMEQYGIKSAKQLGYDVEWSPKHFTILPKGTPADIVAKVDEQWKKGMNDDSFKTGYLDKVGDFLEYKTGPDALTLLQKEFDLEKTMAKEMGLVK